MNRSYRIRGDIDITVFKTPLRQSEIHEIVRQHMRKLAEALKGSSANACTWEVTAEDPVVRQVSATDDELLANIER